MKSRNFFGLMKTKIILSLAVLFLLSMVICAEEKPSVTAKLEQKYDNVEFKKEKGIEYYYLRRKNPHDYGDLHGIADVDGKIILPCSYPGAVILLGVPNKNYDIDCSKEHFWSIPKDKRTSNNRGIADATGKIIVSCIYDCCTYLSPFYTTAGDITNDYGFIFVIADKTVCLPSGKEIISASRGYTQFFPRVNTIDGEKYIFVTKDAKRGLCDMKGNELLPPIYESIYEAGQSKGHQTRFFVIKSDKSSGLYDYKKRMIAVSPKYFTTDAAGNIYYCRRDKDSKYKIYHEDQLLTEADKCTSSFKNPERYTLFRNDGKWGLINEITGHLISFRFDTIMEIQNGNVSVMEEDAMHLYNLASLEKGKKVSVASITKEQAAKAVISDVDSNIPKAKKQDENTFAVIIANENYNDFIVPAANNDGKIFKEYCAQALGIPSENILYYEDATVNHIYAVVKRLKDLADVYDEGCKVIFYYSGQGVTDERTKEMYILPTDGTLKSISSTCYSISRLYREIGTLPNVEQALFLIDAPFNGMTKENKPLEQARGVAIKSIPNKVTGNSIAIEAASEGQTAHVYLSQNHGLFTYYLLKAMQSNIGAKTLLDLMPDVIKNVKDKSTREMKEQQIVQIKTAK